MKDNNTAASAAQHLEQHHVYNSDDLVVTDEAHEAADRLGSPLPHGVLIALDEEIERDRVFVRVLSETGIHRINQNKLRPA